MFLCFAVLDGSLQRERQLHAILKKNHEIKRVPVLRKRISV